MGFTRCCDEGLSRSSDRRILIKRQKHKIYKSMSSFHRLREGLQKYHLDYLLGGFYAHQISDVGSGRLILLRCSQDPCKSVVIEDDRVVFRLVWADKTTLDELVDMQMRKEAEQGGG